MTPKQYENLKNKSQKFQGILLDFIKDKNDKIKAGDLLYEIIDMEINLEAECNK